MCRMVFASRGSTIEPLFLSHGQRLTLCPCFARVLFRRGSASCATPLSSSCASRDVSLTCSVDLKNGSVDERRLSYMRHQMGRQECVGPCAVPGSVVAGYETRFPSPCEREVPHQSGTDPRYNRNGRGYCWQRMREAPSGPRGW